MRSLSKLQPWSLFLLRIVLGTAMLYHGWSKVVPAHGFFHGHPYAALDAYSQTIVAMGLPHVLGYVSALTEFLGGIFLITGFLTRFAAFMVAGNMLVAIIEVNIHKGYTGSEYSLALMVMALLLVTTGSGALSLDRRMGIS